MACLSPDIHVANSHFCFKSLLVKCHLLSSNPHLNCHLPMCLKQMAQLVENLSTYRRHRRRRFEPWIRKIPWRRKLQPTPVFLPEKSHVQRSLVGCSPWGHKESDTTEQNTQTKCLTSILWIFFILIYFYSNHHPIKFLFTSLLLNVLLINFPTLEDMFKEGRDFIYFAHSTA